MTNNLENAPLFSLFWENSKLNKRTILKLGAMFEEDAKTTRTASQFLYPTEDLTLAKPSDKLARLMERRESRRLFNEKPLTEKQLGSLCYAFAAKSDATRILPSAGGKYPIEVYLFLFNVCGKLNGRVMYYNPDNHSLSLVGPCPVWNECKSSFGIDFKESVPAVFFVFAAHAERTIRKYGERGGRFILMEVGHYAQNLALRLAQEKLAGVISGALCDDEIKKYAGLENTNCLITLGFACGNQG